MIISSNFTFLSYSIVHKYPNKVPFLECQNFNWRSILGGLTGKCFVLYSDINLSTLNDLFIPILTTELMHLIELDSVLFELSKYLEN